MNPFAARPRRVAHVIDVCFGRTETFVYDLVCGCRTFEAWCLTRQTANEKDFPFPRVRNLNIRWESYAFWDLVDRVYHRLFRRDDLAVRRALRHVQPAVLHAHFGPTGWEALRYARLLRVPLVTSFYGYDASSLPRQPGWADRLRELFRDGTGFLVEGPAMRKRLEALGCPAEKVFLSPITIYPDRYPFRPRHLGPGEVLRILFVGRFVAKKGLPVLLKALALARPDLGPCELRVIGGGDNAEEMRQLAASLGLEAVVHFLGFLPRHEMVREMDEAHLLAVPSVTAPDGDSEGGAPTVLLEAQASGLPVVTTDHADIPFVVAEAYRDFLAPEGSAEGFAGQLVALRRNADRWPGMAAAGREHVQVQHGPDNFRRLEELYERVIGCATLPPTAKCLESPYAGR